MVVINKNPSELNVSDMEQIIEATKTAIPNIHGMAEPGFVRYMTDTGLQGLNKRNLRASYDLGFGWEEVVVEPHVNGAGIEGTQILLLPHRTDSMKYKKMYEQKKEVFEAYLCEHFDIVK